MNRPFAEPWWHVPKPMLCGVMAMWMPLSVPAMTGILCAVIAYAGLSVIRDNWFVDETWDLERPIDCE